jgi:hypothetical protein
MFPFHLKASGKTAASFLGNAGSEEREVGFQHGSFYFPFAFLFKHIACSDEMI